MAIYFNTANCPHIISWESTGFILFPAQAAIIKNKLNGLQKAVNVTPIMAERNAFYVGE